MANENTLNCKLYISAKDYSKLNDEGKAIFDPDQNSAQFSVDFPAELGNGVTINDCITAFCEVALVMTNDRYQITEGTQLSSELYKLGKKDTTFSLLVTIIYPNSTKKHFDVMTFERLPDEENFRFRLLGDQTMFQMESHS